MSNRDAYKQIVSYIDELHRDLGHLAVFAEVAMGQKGWIPLPSAGDRVCWHMSHTVGGASGWRLPYLCRFFSRQGHEKVDHSVFYLVSLETETALEFPAVLCGRTAHPMLTESEIYNQVFQTHRLRPLLRKNSTWSLSGRESGWTCAEPTFRTPVTHLLIYILNLFDISTKQHVMDNIIRPLTEDAAVSDLRSILTVPSYLPPELAELA